MRRFRFLFLVFSTALLVPMAFLVQRALRSVTLERQMHHQAIAERVFDEMERGLSRLLEEEEERPFEASDPGPQGPGRVFVIGHFEIDSAGKMQIRPSAGRPGAPTAAQIENAIRNFGFGGRRVGETKRVGTTQLPGTTVPLGADDRPVPAPFEAETSDESDASEEVSAFDALRSLNKAVEERKDRQRQAEYGEYAGFEGAARARRSQARAFRDVPAPRRQRPEPAGGEIDVPPLSGRVVDGGYLVLHRTIVRDRQAYRQGALLDVAKLTVWLRDRGLGNDGLAAYAGVSFATPFSPPKEGDEAGFLYRHRFAEPFDDLSARLVLRALPGVGSIAYVYGLSALLFAAGLLGLAALYRMVSVVVAFAERRSNFVAAVSHELKTPLTAIRMYGEMLRDGMVPSEAKRNEYYRHITVESERLSRLINNVLELSLLEKGNREVHLETGSVAPVVRDVAELLRPHVEAEGFDFHVEVDDDSPNVRFERDALTQVLCNLVDNAVKYGADASLKRIVMSCRRDGDGVSVSVRDYGRGVPPRQLGKIFEAFYRGENEVTRRNKGTGIGLALVGGLVERMGARVSGRNAEGGGFEVEIRFAS